MQKTDNPKKVFIRTFGCQMNEYDSDKMLDVLGQERGVVVTQNPEDADIILFNTCSVREKAQEKVFSDLGRIKHLKALNPDLVIGAFLSKKPKRLKKKEDFYDFQHLIDVGRAFCF